MEAKVDDISVRFCTHHRLPGTCLDFMRAAVESGSPLSDLAAHGIQCGVWVSYFGSDFVRDMARCVIEGQRHKKVAADPVREALGAQNGETTVQAAKRIAARPKQDRDLAQTRLEGIEKQFAASVRSLNVCLRADEPWIGKLPEAIARVRKRLAEAETGRDAALKALRTGHVSAEQAPGETANEALSRLRVERDRYRSEIQDATRRLNGWLDEPAEDLDVAVTRVQVRIIETEKSREEGWAVAHQLKGDNDDLIEMFSELSTTMLQTSLKIARREKKS